MLFERGRFNHKHCLKKMSASDVNRRIFSRNHVSSRSNLSMEFLNLTMCFIKYIFHCISPTLLHLNSVYKKKTTGPKSCNKSHASLTKHHHNVKNPTHSKQKKNICQQFGIPTETGSAL